MICWPKRFKTRIKGRFRGQEFRKKFGNKAKSKRNFRLIPYFFIVTYWGYWHAPACFALLDTEAVITTTAPHRINFFKNSYFFNRVKRRKWPFYPGAFVYKTVPYSSRQVFTREWNKRAAINYIIIKEVALLVGTTECIRGRYPIYIFSYTLMRYLCITVIAEKI